MNDFVASLPAVNAALNAVAVVLLIVGRRTIRSREPDRIARHRRIMVAAFAVSILFLVSYITYHTLRQMAEGVGHTRWEVPGLTRYVYYAILLSHVLLAAFLPFLAVATLWLGWRRSDVRHRRLARITWPIWMYVSVTGVLVYGMLYHLHPWLTDRALPDSAREPRLTSP